MSLLEKSSLVQRHPPFDFHKQFICYKCIYLTARAQHTKTKHQRAWYYREIVTDQSLMPIHWLMLGVSRLKTLIKYPSIGNWKKEKKFFFSESKCIYFVGQKSRRLVLHMERYRSEPSMSRAAFFRAKYKDVWKLVAPGHPVTGYIEIYVVRITSLQILNFTPNNGVKIDSV